MRNAAETRDRIRAKKGHTDRAPRRKFIRSSVKKFMQDTSEDVPKQTTSAYSRQENYDDIFTGLYEGAVHGVHFLQPPYLPGRLYEIGEESGALQPCIQAMKTNIDGYGCGVASISGVPINELEGNPVAQAEIARAREIIESPNDRQSLKTLKGQIREDLEYTGNGYMEVVRNTLGIPTMFFWMDSKRVRACALDDQFVDVPIKIVRGGVEVEVTARKKFRRYVMSQASSAKELLVLPKEQSVRFYKEYGDPRIIDAKTGAIYTKQEFNRMGLKKQRTITPASEVLHFKIGNGVYGMPRWIGHILTVIGLSRAEFVNYDLFDTQGIPPTVVMVNGGRLTDESMDDLEALFTAARGTTQFNKLLLLEAEALSTGGLDDAQSKVSIEFKSMMDYRQNDAMFTAYTEAGKKAVRESFRLSELFVGANEGFNYATAVVSRTTAEEQIFIPERASFDELFNKTICSDMGFKFIKIISSGPTTAIDEISKTLTPDLIKNGAFTLNELIEYTNRILGTDFPVHKGKEWADVPIPVFLAMVKGIGVDEGLPEEPEPTPAPAVVAGGQNKPGRKPGLKDKAKGGPKPDTKKSAELEEGVSIVSALLKEFRKRTKA